MLTNRNGAFSLIRNQILTYFETLVMVDSFASQIISNSCRYVAFQISVNLEEYSEVK